MTLSSTIPMEGGVRLAPGVSPAARRWLHQICYRAERDEKIVSIIVTGSSVRPVQASNDLDLLIICRSPVDLAALSHPAEVDLRVFPLSAIDNLIAGGNDALVWAVRYGKPVSDPQGVWRGIVRKWARRLPLPAPERSLARAKVAERYSRELTRMGDWDAAAEQRLSALTHRAWAFLLGRGVLPASRPEIPGQLRSFGEVGLATKMERDLAVRKIDSLAAL